MLVQSRSNGLRDRPIFSIIGLHTIPSQESSCFSCLDLENTHTIQADYGGFVPALSLKTICKAALDR